jgi:hypothetical protein
MAFREGATYPRLLELDLGLKGNDSVVALVKLLVKGDAAGVKLSARNKITGRVTDIQKNGAKECCPSAARN